MRNRSRRWSKLASAIAALTLSAVLLPPPGLADGSVQAPKAALRPITRKLARDDPRIDAMTEQGQRARGLYFSAPVMKRLGVRGIAKKLRAAGLDAAVLDFKDGEGRVTWDTKIASLQPQKRRYIEDVPKFIADLKAAGIYTIARVVCFSDPYLPRNEPDRAIMDKRPGRENIVWASWGKRNTWLDPYNTKNHDLVLAMAKEVEAAGVDEIQFDYIRFPVDEAVVLARFPAQVETPRREVLRGMIKRIDAAVRIPLGADVFGLTALRRGDPAGLGQSLEHWAPHLEVFSPMLYLNGMQSMVPRGSPARAHRLILAAVSKLRGRLGHGPVIRPFLQAFEAGADYYNPEFIAEQVRAARAGGADGFLFWHPGSKYGMVQAGLLGPARGLHPFAIARRQRYRKARWGEPRSEEAREVAAAVDEPVEQSGEELVVDAEVEAGAALDQSAGEAPAEEPAGETAVEGIAPVGGASESAGVTSGRLWLRPAKAIGLRRAEPVPR